MTHRKYEIVWTEHALDRLHKRDFKKIDVQSATDGPTLERHIGNKRYEVIGRGLGGRFVFVVLDCITDRKFEIVSIREASESEKKLYIKKVE
ncbi:MAG: hypothetical protein QMD22_06600 [archaeon]|nr:hypothetical protein [archaeon]